MTDGRKYVLEQVSSFDALSRAREPDGPFVESSPELFKRLNESDEKVIASRMDGNDGVVPFGAGSVVRGKLRRHLFLSVLGDVPGKPAFATALSAFVKANRIYDLTVEFIRGCDETIDIDAFPPCSDILTAELFLVDVFKKDLQFSSNHRRNVNKAKKLGVQIIEQELDAAIADHFRLRQNSFDRRSARGEQIFESYPMRYISTGHARLWQCGVGGEVLSSNLIVFGLDGAWHYESAGTSPEGFKMGASHFLHAETIEAARLAGVRWYDLGGASPANPGLERFKEGFATHRWKKLELNYDLSPAWVRLAGVARTLASEAIGLLRR